MLRSNQLIGFGSGRSYTANAVAFNGSSDSLTRSSAFSGGVNSSTGIFSCWFRNDATPSNMGLFSADVGAGANTTLIGFNASKVRFYTQNAGATGQFEMKSSTTFASSAAWHHVLMSWNTNFASGARLGDLYIDGVNEKNVTTDLGGSGFSNNYATEATFAIAGGGLLALLQGAIAELYLANNQYLDFSVAGNRNKFIQSGKPVSLGLTGSIPTGTAPTIYLPNPAGTVGTNAGTGGNFTINGAPTVASSHP